jgi:hypothetical protein
MIGLFRFVLAILASPFKSKLRLEAENAMLRHQLMVLRRRVRGRVRLTNNDLKQESLFAPLLNPFFDSIDPQQTSGLCDKQLEASPYQCTQLA